jgi:hypothetical protein
MHITDNPDVLPIYSLTAPTRPVLRLNNQLPIRARNVRFEVADHPTLRRDPSLRTRWTIVVRRFDGTTPEITHDAWSDESASRTLDLDLWSDEFYLASALDVTVAHYRPPYQPGAELLTMTSPHWIVADRFRRDLPYVRWHREISWDITVDGERVTKSKWRLSAVHKTSIWERCKFCDTGSNRPIGPAGMEYFATLPPVAKDGFRVELCPYCFPDSQ